MTDDPNKFRVVFLMDAALIAAAQRVEHYEIAAYSTASGFARVLGDSEHVSLLEETLHKEKETDEKLTTLAEEINPQANVATEQSADTKPKPMRSNVRLELILKGEKSMASRASIKKHPIHPMLVALPIGLWIFALVCDVVRAAGGAANWESVDTYCIAAGIVGALIAGVPGLIDYHSIDEAEMKRIGTLHLAANLGAVAIFAIDLWLRFRLPAESNVPLALSIIGILAIGVGGWLGGEMVYVKGMAVEAVEKLAKKVEEPRRCRAA